MNYRIEYFREGRQIGETPWHGTLERTVQIARDGLINHNADFARIIDVDGSGAEVESVRREDRT